VKRCTRAARCARPSSPASTWSPPRSASRCSTGASRS
jgi:hypothetical protein